MSVNEHILIDAKHKERAYKELAHSFLATGDVWISFHAQFLADLASILVLEAESPALRKADGEIPLLAVLELIGDEVGKKDARQTMELIRDKVETLIDPKYSQKWRDSLAPIDYLRDKKLSPDNTKIRKQARLRRLDPWDFIDLRFREADSNARDSLTALKNDDKFEALKTAYASDLAVFEAWLIARSIESGDDNLILTELKWSLAMTSLSAPRNPADEFKKTVTDIRSRLVWSAGGPAEARDLARHFAKLI